MTKDIFWPAYAYVPGQTPRHPEHLFAAIRDTAVPGLSISQLAECQAFKVGLCYLDAGFYWEAHEVLEPVWMVLPVDGVERKFVQGLIQLANGLLKLEMDRPKASLRLVKIARSLVPSTKDGAIMAVDIAKTHLMIDSLEAAANDAL